MAVELNMLTIERNIRISKEIANYLYSQSYRDKKLTIVVKFERSYFVFVVGRGKFQAYPLSTTKFKYFEDAEAIYNFLKTRSIRAVYQFFGELNHIEIKNRIEVGCEDAQIF